MRRRREMQWAARINAALEEGRFELYRMAIQPLQRVEVGAHYELLLRLKDEGGRIVAPNDLDRKSTRLNSSHSQISYAVFCLKKKKQRRISDVWRRARRSPS